jgi:hypothetical protein
MKLIIILFILVSTPFISHGQEDKNFGLIEQSITYINAVFETSNKNVNNLDAISLSDFRETLFYQRLKVFAEAKSSLVFDKSREYWTQYYIIGEDRDNHVLAVIFEKDKVKKRWKVNEWVITKDKKEVAVSDNIPLISFQEFGADLLNLLNRLELPIKDKKINLSKYSKYSFDNIGVYENSKLKSAITLNFTFMPITDKLSITGWCLSGGSIVLDTDEPQKKQEVDVFRTELKTPLDFQKLIDKYKVPKTARPIADKTKIVGDKTIYKLDCSFNQINNTYRISFKMSVPITDMQMDVFLERVRKTIIVEKNTIKIPFGENFTISSDISSSRCKCLAEKMITNFFFKFEEYGQIKDVKCLAGQQAMYLEISFE